MPKKKTPVDEVTGRPVQPFTQLDTSYDGIIETTPASIKKRAEKAIKRAERMNASRRRKKTAKK